MHAKSWREAEAGIDLAAAHEWALSLVSVEKRRDALRAAARAVVEAWNENEIGQVDGALINALAEPAGLHIQDGYLLELEP